MYNFVDIIWWHNSFILLLLQFLFRKRFQILAKKSFRALVGTIGLHSNSGTSFMSMVIKGMVRITNEDRQLLSSFSNSNHSFDCQAHKRNPRVEMQTHIVPTKARKDFLAKIWNLFLKRNCNNTYNRRMKESYATKLCPQNCTHLCFILWKFEYHQCIW